MEISSSLRANPKKLLLADITLLSAAFIWGVTFTVIKQALLFTTPFLFMALRFGLALIIITLVANRNLCQLTRKEIEGGILTGAALFLGFTFQTWGLVYTTASKSAFITGLNVVLVPFMLWSLGHQHIRGKRWLAASLAIVGLLLLTDPTGSSGINRGDMFTLICAVAFAAQIILLGIYSPAANAVRYFWIQLITVTILSIGATAITGGWRLESAADLWVGLAITGVAGTAFAFLGMTWAQKYAQPTRVALIIASEPVFGALFAVIVAGEVLSGGAWLGGALIVTMIIWSEAGNKT